MIDSRKERAAREREKNMKAINIKIFLSFLLVINNSIFPCTKEQAIEAEQTVFKIFQWNELFEAIEKYPCDDGAIAEGFCQAVSNCVRMNANGLQKIEMSKEQWDFILKHTNEVWPQVEAEQAIDSLLKYCEPEDGSYAWTIVTKLRRFKQDLIRKEMEMQKLIRCNMDILNEVSKRMETLEEGLIDSFFNNFGFECKNNVEFGEWSNEFLFSVIIRKPAISIKLLSDINENSRKTILEELKNPVHDGIDMRAAYVGLQKVKSGSIIQYEMMEAISSGFIEKTKTD